uniref:Trophozoite antigen n=1 Tax=Parastrongyloides trichosuri TaxID=131310 RepID=A0A0N4Z4M2_PARTI
MAFRNVRERTHNHHDGRINRFHGNEYNHFRGSAQKNYENNIEKRNKNGLWLENSHMSKISHKHNKKGNICTSKSEPNFNLSNFKNNNKKEELIICHDSYKKKNIKKCKVFKIISEPDPSIDLKFSSKLRYNLSKRYEDMSESSI